MATAPLPVAAKTPKSAAASARRGSKVRVVARVRPFLPSERVSPDQVPCISLLDSEGGDSQEVTIHIKDQGSSRNECYKLDSFYGQQSHLSEVFHREVFPLLPEIFHGFNATVFAYGATGSGKTYTMQGTDEEPGLMSLAMSTILSMCESTGSYVEISYFEIYMERCYDLLEPKAKEISVFEKNGQVQLKGLSQVPVSSISEFHEVFASGVQRRRIAPTNLNDVSSRSHGVLMIVISSCGEGSDSVSGKLNLIDLAGNEDNKKTCNEGIRLQESATINQSLFALSKVICALNNNKPYVPYRDSKLTRILQDSLGGTSHSLMIACLNPISYQEAIHTVSLAARSRQIVNYISSDRKQESQKEKVDMEAKLRAWLESKGKTRNAQRIGVLFSPYLGRTPKSMSTVKRPDLNLSSAKKKIADQEKLNLRGRKLFDFTTPDTAVTKKTVQHESENSEYHADNERDDGSCFLSQECSKEQSIHLNKAGRNEVDRDMRENLDAVHSSTFQYTDESQDKENMENSLSHDCVGCPSIEDRIEALKGSIRKAFAPVNLNAITPPREDLSPNDQFSVVKFKARSPETPYVAINPPMAGTPLDRFHSCTSNLKNSLVEEYLEFLNTASKEDLQRLKGIGSKRADYILELRENSPYPIKSLSDLEKIGLSSKQVRNIFRKTIRGIFS